MSLPPPQPPVNPGPEEIHPFDPNAPGFWQRQGRKVLFGSVGLLVLAVGATLAYPELKAWRGRKLAREADAILAAADPTRFPQAYEKARSAHQLAPRDLEVVRTVAQVMGAAEPERGLEFYRQAVELSQGALEDRLALATALMLQGKLAAADRELAAAEPLSPENHDLRVLRIEVAARLGRLEEAWTRARALCAAPSAPASDFILLARVAAARPEASGRQQARERIQARIDSGAEGADSLLRTLALQPDLPAEARVWAAQRLDREGRSREDRLEGLRLWLSLPDAAAPALEQRALALFDLARPEEQLLCGRWLNQNGGARRTLEIIPEAQALQRQDLYLVRVDALALLDRWADVERLLGQPRAPVPDHINHLFRMRSLQERGEARTAAIEWNKALLAASGDGVKLSFLAQYARRLNLWAEYRLALERLSELPSTMRPAFEQLLLLGQASRDTGLLLDTLARMHARFPADDAVANDLAYHRLLVGEHIPESRAEAERLLRANPDYLAHHMTAILGELRAGDPARALQRAQDLGLDWSKANPRHRLVIACVLAANGQSQRAADFARDLKPDQFLIEERRLAREFGVELVGAGAAPAH